MENKLLSAVNFFNDITTKIILIYIIKQFYVTLRVILLITD